jgi:predicted CopG family antitoxin
MKTIQITDELHAKLKDFVVDPFDDTPDAVITRLIEIADKAKGRWSTWDAEEENKKQSASQEKRGHGKQDKNKDQAEDLSYL